ncbi:LOW QUALITY PROTEIN: apoptosis-stimulating of p53 protein 1-like [Diretmus argenteus]
MKGFFGLVLERLVFLSKNHKLNKGRKPKLKLRAGKTGQLLCVKRRRADNDTPAVLAGVHVNCDIDAGFQKQMESMFHTAYYVVKKEKPFTDFPDLVQLNSRTGSNMPNCYKSDKACSRFTIDIYNVEREQLLADLKHTRYISVMIDGATDSGVLENEIVYIKYFTEERGVVQSFLGIEDVKHAHADGVLSAVQSVFEKAGLEKWKEKMVFFCADGAAVNMGRKNGVAAKLKEEMGHLISIHCVAHRLELGMVDSIKAEPRLKQLQEVLHYLHMQYHYSPKALRELRMLADALEDKVLKPTNLKGARWLPYIHKATQILCNGYAVFVAHFEDQVSPERTPKPSPAVVGRAKNILQYLKTKENVQFMHFLLDTLEFLKTLSLQFQQNNLTPGEAVQYIEACINGLTELRLEPDILTKHIESRLGDLLSADSIVAKFSALDHHMWPKPGSTDDSKEAFVIHGRADMESLCHHYESILVREGTTASEVMGEYRLYKIWARSRTMPLRDTLLLMLQRVAHVLVQFFENQWAVSFGKHQLFSVVIKVRETDRVSQASQAMFHAPLEFCRGGAQAKWYADPFIEPPGRDEGCQWAARFIQGALMVILTVYLNDSQQMLTEVPVTPATRVIDVVEYCKEAGEGECHLAEVWSGHERVLPQELLLLDLLQQWGARRPEVSFYLRHHPSWPQGTAKQITSTNRYTYCATESVPRVELTLSELQEMATRQQQQIEAQQQMLVAKEQRLRYLQQGGRSNQGQTQSEAEKLQRLKERVESQEAKLKKIRAMRGQVDYSKLINGNLSAEIDHVSSLFQEKQAELQSAVVRVDQLTQQLDDLRRGRLQLQPAGPQQGPHPGSQGAPTGLEGSPLSGPAALELRKLYQELQARNRHNLEQSSKLAQNKDLLNKRNTQVTVMDKRIGDLRERLHKKRAELSRMNGGGLPPPQTSPHPGGGASGRVAAVCPYIQVPTGRRQEAGYPLTPDPPPKPTPLSHTRSLSEEEGSGVRKPPSQWKVSDLDVVLSELAEKGEGPRLHQGGDSKDTNEAPWPSISKSVSEWRTTSPEQLPSGYGTYPSANHQAAGHHSATSSLPRSAPGTLGWSRSAAAKASSSSSSSSSSSQQIQQRISIPPTSNQGSPTTSQPSPLSQHPQTERPDPPPAVAVRPYVPDHPSRPQSPRKGPATMNSSSIYSMYLQQPKNYGSLSNRTTVKAVYGKPVLPTSSASPSPVPFLQGGGGGGGGRGEDVVDKEMVVGRGGGESGEGTPLHCAASCNSVHLCKMLVESGAAIFATTISDVETAADKCEEMEEGYTQCSQFLYGVQEKLGVMNKGLVYALWDYTSQQADELSFSEGDALTVLRRGDDVETEWWWARLNDREGYIPRNLLGLYPRIKPRQRSLA